MRPNADAWLNLSMTQETEPYGYEWRSDGIVVQSWPVAMIQHCNNAKRSYLESQLTSWALLVGQAALADQFAFIIPRRLEVIAARGILGRHRKAGGTEQTVSAADHDMNLCYWHRCP